MCFRLCVQYFYCVHYFENAGFPRDCGGRWNYLPKKKEVLSKYIPVSAVLYLFTLHGASALIYHVKVKKFHFLKMILIDLIEFLPHCRDICL